MCNDFGNFVKLYWYVIRVKSSVNIFFISVLCLFFPQTILPIMNDFAEVETCVEVITS